MPGLISDLLSGVTAAFGTDVYSIAKDDVLDAEQWPLAQRLELANCCKLCATINGRIVRKSDPAYRKWLRQVHMNCRGIWVDIHKDEGHEEVGPDGTARWVPTQPTWHDSPIPEELLQRHGHFIHEPEKYAALNLPARPTGRDFIFVRNQGDLPGTLIFAPNLPDKLLKSTLAEIAGKTMAAAAAGSAPLDSLAATLEQCVSQPAMRAIERPQEFILHFDQDARKHGVRLGLDDGEYAAIPQAVLMEPHRLAIGDYTFTSDPYKGQTRKVLMVATERAVNAKGEILGFYWEPAKGNIFHPGKFGLRYFLSKADFQPLTGVWK